MTPDPTVIDESARDHVIVEGADALTYLQSQVSQDVRDLSVGDVCWTFVLAPTGRVDALARLTRTDVERFDLDTDAGFGDLLAARLNRFKIRVQADIIVVGAMEPEPSAEHEAARVAAGWPRMGAEIVPGETIPASTGVVPVAVSFTKGCYPGQELVERMDSRGADAPEQVRVVDVEAAATAGDPLLDHDGARVGTLTSVAPSDGVAIALIRRGATVGRLPAHLR